MKREAVYLDDELFAYTVTDDECRKLSADQLRQAIDDYEVDIVRRPDGSYTLMHADSDSYEFRPVV
jgi:hypothetical protein